jgi:hypothetical protein
VLIEHTHIKPVEIVEKQMVARSFWQPFGHNFYKKQMYLCNVIIEKIDLTVYAPKIFFQIYTNVIFAIISECNEYRNKFHLS